MNLRLLRKLRILMSPSTFRLRLRSTLKPETAHTSGSQQNDVRSHGFLFFCKDSGSMGAIKHRQLTQPYPRMMSFSLVAALICGIVIMLQGCSSSVEYCRSEGGGRYCWACGCRCIGDCNITNGPTTPQACFGCPQVVSDPECLDYERQGNWRLENRDELCAALSDNQCSCAGTERSMGT